MKDISSKFVMFQLSYSCVHCGNLCTITYILKFVIVYDYLKYTNLSKVEIHVSAEHYAHKPIVNMILG